MCLEGQTGGNSVSATESIVTCSVGVANGKGGTSLDAGIVGQRRGLPCSEAQGVAEVAPLIWRVCSVEISEGVELLGRIIDMNIDTIASDVISTVLHGIELTGNGVLIDADIVAQAPTEQQAVGVEVVDGSTVEQVKGLDLAVAGSNVLGERVDVGSAPTRHDKETIDEARQQQRTCGVIVGSHVGNDDGAIVGDTSGG